MSARAQEIDVKLLLFAIQRTTTFENLLAQRFVHHSNQVRQMRNKNKISSIKEMGIFITLAVFTECFFNEKKKIDREEQTMGVTIITLGGFILSTMKFLQAA